MNLKPFAFAAALLASGSTLASPGKVPVAASGCRGQAQEMVCSKKTGRATQTVLVNRCADSTFTGELQGPGPTDATVTLFKMPVSKVIPRGGSMPGYLGTQPRGGKFELWIDTKKPLRGGGHVGHFTLSRPGPDDKMQTTKLDLDCHAAK